MAKFDAELNNSMMKSLEKMERNAGDVMGEMVEAGSEVVLRNIRSNMRSSFKTTRSLEEGLGKTKVYKTPSDDGVNVQVGFRGYNRKGVPIPLIAGAREKGTSRGEKRKTFFRRSFKKALIESAMKAKEPKLFEGVQ